MCFKDQFPNFNGKILEVGAGTGYLARDILNEYKNVEYSILDLENHFPVIKNTLKDFPHVNYIPSRIYEEIFDHDWDMLVSTHCLSETPDYYYSNIFQNIKVKE
jgi:SAM-dependent MidA family methyltransferase